MLRLTKEYINSVFYCRECKKIYQRCYEFDGINLCSVFFSEDIKVITEKSMIRTIKIKKLNEIERNE